MSELEQEPFQPQGVDSARPSVARVYDWYLGGTANWAIDREFGKQALAEPIALLVTAVLHVQQPDANGVDVGPRSVARYRELLPSGSYLVRSQITNEGLPDDIARQLANMINMYDNAVTKHVLRSHEEIRALFGDFELVQPGMTWTAAWHPEETAPGSTLIEFGGPNESAMYAGVGLKP